MLRTESLRNDALQHCAATFFSHPLERKVGRMLCVCVCMHTHTQHSSHLSPNKKKIGKLMNNPTKNSAAIKTGMSTPSPSEITITPSNSKIRNNLQRLELY